MQNKFSRGDMLIFADSKRFLRRHAVIDSVSSAASAVHSLSIIFPAAVSRMVTGNRPLQYKRSLTYVRDMLPLPGI